LSACNPAISREIPETLLRRYSGRCLHSPPASSGWKAVAMASIAIVAEIAMVVKHHHYLIPVLTLSGFVNSSLWVTLPRSGLNRP
jgi:hypothetical protein